MIYGAQTLFYRCEVISDTLTFLTASGTEKRPPNSYTARLQRLDRDIDSGSCMTPMFLVEVNVVMLRPHCPQVSGVVVAQPGVVTGHDIGYPMSGQAGLGPGQDLAPSYPLVWC